MSIRNNTRRKQFNCGETIDKPYNDSSVIHLIINYRGLGLGSHCSNTALISRIIFWNLIPLLRVSLFKHDFFIWTSHLEKLIFYLISSPTNYLPSYSLHLLPILSSATSASSLMTTIFSQFFSLLHWFSYPSISIFHWSSRFLGPFYGDPPPFTHSDHTWIRGLPLFSQGLPPYLSSKWAPHI